MKHPHAYLSLMSLLISALLLFSGCQASPTDTGSAQRFLELIGSADRIVVRDGGFNCCGPVDEDKILFAVTSRKEIVNLRNNLMFTNPGSFDCGCCGWPGIDWYKGGKRIVLSGIKHEISIKWTENSPGNGSFFNLTKDSQIWLANWFESHGVPEPKSQLLKTLEDTARYELIDAILARHIPRKIQRILRNYNQALGDQYDLTEKQEYAIILKTFQSEYKSTREFQLDLLRTLGCVPLPWQYTHDSAQETAKLILERLSFEERKQLLNSIVDEKDDAVREGALRLAFAIPLVNNDGSTFANSEFDLPIADVYFIRAYASEFPHNRLLMLRVLDLYPNEAALPAFEQAIEDPDSSVRAWTIKMLANRGNSKDTIALLEKVAAGKTHPRPNTLSTFVSNMFPEFLHTDPLPGEDNQATDIELAKKLLKEIKERETNE